MRSAAKLPVWSMCKPEGGTPPGRVSPVISAQGLKLVPSGEVLQISAGSTRVPKYVSPAENPFPLALAAVLGTSNGKSEALDHCETFRFALIFLPA
jgi:hypothetical protein